MNGILKVDENNKSVENVTWEDGSFEIGDLVDVDIYGNIILAKFL